MSRLDRNFVSERFRVALCMGLCVLLVGCQDGPFGPGRDASEQRAITEHETELDGAQAFDVELHVTGALLPNRPISISALARANTNVDNAEFKIAAPEFVVAEANEWSDRRARSSGAIRALVSERSSAAAGSRKHLTTQLTVKQPGYYRVVASALATELTSANSQLIQTEVHRDAWLLITDAGGRITSEFEVGLIPMGMIPQPGPFRPIRGGTSAIRRDASMASRNASTMDDWSDHWRLEYYNNTTGTYDPIPYVYITVTYYEDDYQGNEVELHTETVGASAADGSFAVYCAGMNYNQRYQLTGYLSNGLVAIHLGSSGMGGNNASDCATNSAASPYRAGMESNKAHVWVNMNRDIAASRQFFGTSRGQMLVKVYNTGTGANYSASADDIEIWYNNIWGSFGRFTAAHEYGHALHEKGLGGNAASGSCPSPHRIDQATNLRCALSEGFASYHASAVDAAYFNLESADYTYGCTAYYASGACMTRATTRDGSIVEGAVASFLNDLTDSASDTGDSTTYPGLYVADIIRTCRVNTQVGISRINGIDYMSYCLELGVDPVITYNYFRTRTESAYNIYSEYAAEPASWSSTAVRYTWLWNLYRQ